MATTSEITGGVDQRLQLIENTEQRIIKIGTKKPGGGELLTQLAPGPNLVPGDVWAQARDQVGVQRMMDAGMLDDHGVAELHKLKESVAVRMVNRLAGQFIVDSAPVAKVWKQKEKRPRIIEVLDAILKQAEAAEALA